MQRHPNAADLQALLAKLSDVGVEFIIVGGASAVMQGAPITSSAMGRATTSCWHTANP